MNQVQHLLPSLTFSFALQAGEFLQELVHPLATRGAARRILASHQLLLDDRRLGFLCLFGLLRFLCLFGFFGLLRFFGLLHLGLRILGALDVLQLFELLELGLDGFLLSLGLFSILVGFG